MALTDNYVRRHFMFLYKVSVMDIAVRHYQGIPPDVFRPNFRLEEQTHRLVECKQTERQFYPDKILFWPEECRMPCKMHSKILCCLLKAGVQVFVKSVFFPQE